MMRVGRWMGKSAAGHLRVRTDKAAAELDMDFGGSSWKPDWRPRWPHPQGGVSSLPLAAVKNAGAKSQSAQRNMLEIAYAENIGNSLLVPLWPWCGVLCSKELLHSLWAHRVSDGGPIGSGW